MRQLTQPELDALIIADPLIMPPLTAAQTLPISAQGYSRWILEIYDWLILRISSTVVWRCPTPRLLSLYRHYLSHRHLEVGVGTGYLLDHGTFPTLRPQLTLLDCNPQVLAHAKRRLQRYSPSVVVQDVMQADWPQLPRYRSIGLSYVWHALTGTESERVAMLRRLADCLDRDGMLFGSTVVGIHAQMSGLAQSVSRHWQRVGVFNNQDDTYDSVQAALLQVFDEVHMWQVGYVVLFVATQPKRS